MTEQWLPIPGHIRYQVSNLGRVRSMRYAAPRVLKPAKNVVNDYRYLTVISDEGKPWSIQVHRLVLLAFVGPMPEGKETRHLDGDKENNTLLNLVYGTRLENMDDKRRHGTNVGNRGTSGPRVVQLESDELRITDAAAYLGCTATTLRRYVTDGLLTASKRSGVWVFTKAALDGVVRPKVGRPVSAVEQQRRMVLAIFAEMQRQEAVVATIRIERAA